MIQLESSGANTNPFGINETDMEKLKNGQPQLDIVPAFVAEDYSLLNGSRANVRSVSSHESVLQNGIFIQTIILNTSAKVN